MNGDSAIALAASLQLMPHAKEVLLQNNNIDVRGAMPCRAVTTEWQSSALPRRLLFTRARDPDCQLCAGCAALASVLHTANVQALNLSNNHITAVAFEHLIRGIASVRHRGADFGVTPDARALRSHRARRGLALRRRKTCSGSTSAAIASAICWSPGSATPSRARLCSRS